MNNSRFTVAPGAHRLRGVALFLLLFCVVHAATAVEVDTNEFARCAALTAVDTRVACYDALAKAVLPTAGQATPPAHSTEAQVAHSPSPPAAAPGAVTIDPTSPAQFGLSQRQLKASAGPESIKAIVSQITEDRRNNVSLVLDNGQTWTFIEPDPRVRPGDTVTIKRAALGSFLMLTPSRRSYRVERVQ